MPSYCVICEFKWNKDSSTSFHKFNFDRGETLHKWTEFVRRCKGQPEWKPSRWSSICNKHFLPTDFKANKGTLRKHLKPDAIPTIEIPPQNGNTEEIPSSRNVLSLPLLDTSATGSQCRLCTQIILATVGGLNIFRNANLHDWTMNYLRPLNILAEDQLTKFVCTTCYQQLERFHRFYETAVCSQNTLNTSLHAASSSTFVHCPPSSHRLIKQEPPMVSIKEESHLLTIPPAPPTVTHETSEDFANNLSSLLSDFCHYDLSSGHILEITDLTNDFINLTDDNEGEALHERKPNILAARNNSQGMSLKQEEDEDDDGASGLLDEFLDEDGLFKAMINNEHSYCKFNHLLGENSLRLIKTEKKEEITATAGQQQAAVPQNACGNVPKIYIIDNALIKHNCDRCGDMFETRPMLIDHQRRVHDRFLCGRCGRRCANFSSFYFHKLNCSYRVGYMTAKRKYWRCKECRWHFKLQLGWENHRKRRICGSVQRIRRNRRRRVEEIKQKRELEQKGDQAVVGKFICDICNKRFTRRSNLTQHEVTHLEKRSHACQLCDKVFKRPCGLKAHHKAAHLKLRPFQCTVCKRGFALKTDMRRCRHAAHKEIRSQQSAVGQRAEGKKGVTTTTAEVAET